MNEPFASSLFPFVATSLAPHKNPVTCILAGIDRPLVVCTQSERVVVEGDIVIIRPGVEHAVDINGHARVLYFDGLEYPLHDTPLAARLPREFMTLAIDALRLSSSSSSSAPPSSQESSAQEELRARLAHGRERWPTPAPARIAQTIAAITHDPMLRMDQNELANRLRLNRTQALRAFKAATGMAFRAFKRWTALCAATRQIANGELVRTAAMDAGFADTAHLTRTFRTTFGTTPTLATADRRR